MATPFEKIYNKFFGKITDDLYLEMTYEDTLRDVKSILLDAIPYFEFPRFALYNYDEDLEQYNVDLTVEEVNIFAILMKITWLNRQIDSVEVTRMKYSGSDFKMTSQANHLSKLISSKSESQRENIHAQRLYKRRKTGADGRIMSNWSILNYGTFEAANSNVPTPIPPSDSSSGGSGGCTGDCKPDWKPLNPNEKPEEKDEYLWEPIR